MVWVKKEDLSEKQDVTGRWTQGSLVALGGVLGVDFVSFSIKEHGSWGNVHTVHM